MSTIAFWMDLRKMYGFKIDTSNVGMYKSELLGRLMRGEEVRRRPCPRHRGKMWCLWGSTEQMSGHGECCQGTGWLKNEAK